MAMPSTDSDELAKFGYKQELDRSLGLFSSFAAGFSYISIMTGVFELFFFGFASGGAAWIWTWPAVLAGQMLVALCFAELAGQFPLAGSVYQWSKQIAGPFTSFFGGWILTVGSIVTLAAVAVAYQIVLPLISSRFEIIGGPSDIGLVSTPGGAKNALLLAAALVVFTTVINMVGVKTMARINNFGVAAELVGVSLLIILLAVHIHRGPGASCSTPSAHGTGHPVRLLRRPPGRLADQRVRAVRVRHRGSLAEETHDPRRHAPPAISGRWPPPGVARLLVIVLGRDGRAEHPRHRRSGTSGLPYMVKATLGGTVGNVFLIDSIIAITVCSLAVHAGGIRMIFTMGRDGRAAGRVGHRAGARPVQDAAGPVDRDRRPHHRAAGPERRKPARVLRAHLGRDHHVLHRLPVRHRAAADRPACAASGRRPSTARTSRWAAGGCW